MIPPWIPSVTKNGETMSVAKKFIITSSSKSSFEDALDQGLMRASDTLRGITELEVRSQKAFIKDGEIREYRIECEMTFVLDS